MSTCRIITASTTVLAGNTMIRSGAMTIMIQIATGKVTVIRNGIRSKTIRIGGETMTMIPPGVAMTNIVASKTKGIMVKKIMSGVTARINETCYGCLG